MLRRLYKQNRHTHTERHERRRRINWKSRQVRSQSQGEESRLARTHPTRSRTNPQEKDITQVADKPQSNRKHANDFSIEQGNINTILSPRPKHLRLFNQSIAINSTVSKDIDGPETKQPTFVGSKMETALLQFVQDLSWESWKETHESAKIVQTIPFSSERKATGVVHLRPC